MTLGIQMRAGTQTLIQALQAMPWEDGSGDDDGAVSATPATAETNVREESSRRESTFL